MPTSAIPTPDDIWKILKEVSSIQKEVASIQKETNKKIQKLSDSQKETDKQLKKTENLFTTQWGRLVESLVEGDLVPILNQKGIKISNTFTNVKQRGRGDDFEYDIIAANGEEIVVVEVKTTLRADSVKDFLGNLKKFTSRMPHYKNKIIYGAVAWLRAEQEADIHAEKQGLFVIRATGSSASIVNKENFKPQLFS